VTAPAAHSAFFALAVLAAVAAFALAPIGLGAQLVLLAILVALLGIPHGALDADVARMLWPLRGWRAEAAFTAFYVTLTALVLLLWWAAPSVALFLFLGYSALHFSDDWSAAFPVLPRLAGGTLVVGAPLLFRPEESAAIFAFLAPAPAAAASVALFAALGLGAAATLLLLFAPPAARTADGRRALLELGAIALAAWALPPLVYFVVYFCLLHSPRHFARTAAGLGYGPRRAVRAAIPATLVTVAGAAAAGLALWRLGMGGDETTLRIVFITLAALTVPHMILVDRFTALRGRVRGLLRPAPG
jgi:Brp/Blh family beta-carotene 15,15'-monooxygenase